MDGYEKGKLCKGPPGHDYHLFKQPNPKPFHLASFNLLFFIRTWMQNIGEAHLPQNPVYFIRSNRVKVYPDNWARTYSRLDQHPCWNSIGNKSKWAFLSFLPENLQIPQHVSADRPTGPPYPEGLRSLKERCWIIIYRCNLCREVILLHHTNCPEVGFNGSSYPVLSSSFSFLTFPSLQLTYLSQSFKIFKKTPPLTIAPVHTRTLQATPHTTAAIPSLFKNIFRISLGSYLGYLAVIWNICRLSFWSKTHLWQFSYL